MGALGKWTLSAGAGVGALWVGSGSIKSWQHANAIADRGEICESFGVVEMVCNQQYAVESVLGSSAISDTLGNPMVLGDTRVAAAAALAVVAVLLGRSGRKDLRQGNTL